MATKVYPMSRPRPASPSSKARVWARSSPIMTATASMDILVANDKWANLPSTTWAARNSKKSRWKRAWLTRRAAAPSRAWAGRIFKDVITTAAPISGTRQWRTRRFRSFKTVAAASSGSDHLPDAIWLGTGAACQAGATATFDFDNDGWRVCSWREPGDVLDNVLAISRRSRRCGAGRGCSATWATVSLKM